MALLQTDGAEEVETDRRRSSLNPQMMPDLQLLVEVRLQQAHPRGRDLTGDGAPALEPKHQELNDNNTKVHVC